MIVVSKDIFAEQEYSLEETPLEPCVECVEVTPYYMELNDATLIDLPPKDIQTSSVLPSYTPSSHSFMDPSISNFHES